MADSKKFPFDLMQCVEVTSKGAFMRVGSDSFFTQRLAYHSATSDKLEYLGMANPGLGVSASGWAIKRISYDGSARETAIEWANSELSLKAVWDDRVNEAYG